MWAVMERFGCESLPDEINGPKVHRLENVMALVSGFRMHFDELRVWFVATVRSTPPILYGYPEFVTFTTLDQDNLPVPSPTYLAIHAACAKLVHLSGAAECIAKLYRDMESRTLHPDGAAASMLEHAIFQLQVRGYKTVD